MSKLQEAIVDLRFDRCLKRLSTKETRGQASLANDDIPPTVVFRIAETSANVGDVANAAAWLRHVPTPSEVTHAQKVAVASRALRNSSRQLDRLYSDLWEAHGILNRTLAVFAGGEAIRHRELAGKIAERYK
ncbi:MAG TPA: hypothetical protein VLG12_00995 [Candidatus Saccharimonadales bacterium]|nr:hypothetical protein [Candidatus Saccharimonadales bacterium]